MTRLERAIAYLSPAWAAERTVQRMRLEALGGAYDATRKSRLRKETRDAGSGSAIAQRSAVDLRNYARHLERNHDLARGILNTLVQNTIGANGISVEPTPRGPNGEIDEGIAQLLGDLWDDWTKLPEVTGEFDWPRAQRMLARSWFRDGEVLFQHLRGNVPFLNHGTTVPYSIELIEADLLPIDYDDTAKRISMGIEFNAWGRPVAYHVFKRHPGDQNGFVTTSADVKRIAAEHVEHIKLIDRIGQGRGLSVFASVLTRLDDLKDYEESERIAAKVAASMTAFIKRGQPDDYAPERYLDANGVAKTTRHLNMVPGLVIDDLLPGEDVGTIASNRPNPNAASWRKEQLRATSSGVYVSYSSASRDYNGTYSAQRQELVESWGAYALLTGEFIDQCPRQVYEACVVSALTAGEVELPRGWSLKQLLAAQYVAPAMPWIDPVKEATAFDLLERNCLVSGPEIIRKRGGNPRAVRQAEAIWRRQLKADGLSTAAPAAANDAPPPPPPDDADDETETREASADA
jgi:lambda family phage portal protein